MQKIGPKIKQLRVLHNLNQDALAAKVGISPSYLSHIERGNRDVDTELLSKFAEQLGCHITDFFESGSGGQAPLEKLSKVLTSAFIRDGKLEMSTRGDEPTPPYPGIDSGYWFRVKDALMAPRYFDGDMVFIHESIGVQDGEFAVVIDSLDLSNPMVRQVFLRGDNYVMITLSGSRAPVIAPKDRIKFAAPILFTRTGR